MISVLFFYWVSGCKISILLEIYEEFVFFFLGGGIDPTTALKLYSFNFDIQHNSLENFDTAWISEHL